MFDAPIFSTSGVSHHGGRLRLIGPLVIAGRDSRRRSTGRTHPHFAAKAKRIIFIFLSGGPSQVDTFDYKPLLARDDGKPFPFDKPKVQFNSTGNSP